MSDTGLPKNARLFRCVVYLPTEGGDKRHPFPSALMTHSSATAAMVEHQREGRKDCEVIVDKDASLKWQAAHPNRKTK